MLNIGEETRNRRIYFKFVKSVSKLLPRVIGGSQQSWHRCSSTEMVSQDSTCISSIYLDSQSTEKGIRGGESAFSNNSNSNLANPRVVRTVYLSIFKDT